MDNFNRIITVKFFSKDADGKKAAAADYVINCPTYGRKPNIEISGLWNGSTSIPTFNLKIRNLYIKDRLEQYQFIEVIAGYQNNLKTFSGQISYMFTESPGPESVTVIMCMFGSLDTWLNTKVSLNYKSGFKFETVFNEIAQALGKTPEISDSIKTLSSNAKLQFDGLAKDSLEKLKKCYTKLITITPQENKLLAYVSGEEQDMGLKIDLKVLTAPPQLIGGTDNVVTVTVISLWNPKITPGTVVSFNAKYYSTTLAMSSSADMYKIKVTSVNFHFSTVHGGNEMTLIGNKV